MERLTMMDAVEARIELMDKILSGEYGLEETKKQINALEKKFGYDFLLDAECERKSQKFWNKKYLEKLENDCISGMVYSKPLMLHLAEVSEYIHDKEKNKKLFITIGSVGGIAIIGYFIVKIIKLL